MVYYRKYRPQLISELDLDSVSEKLKAILSSKNLPHAFLFTGSKGLGKTSSARILAKAINCERRGQITADSQQEEEKAKQKLNAENYTLHADIEPCNKCEACITITNGSNIDVLEIDAASNGGVEEIRTLRERVKFAPSMLKKKVYIIDEVHMLSTGAFNALLKTLEEPPSHVVFILATTELHKLPATVVSRTFQVQFEKPTVAQMTNSLKRIVVGEKLKVGRDVLEKVAEISDGAFRDAAKNLEELVLASRGEDLTMSLFEKAFRTGSVEEGVYELLASFEKRDAKKGLQVISGLIDHGTDFKIVIEKLVDHLRGLLMLRNGIESKEKDIVGLGISDIRELLELSNEAYGELKMSIIPSLPLELMVVKFCILNDEIQPAISMNLSTNQQSKTTNFEQITEDQKKPTVILQSKNLLPDLINELNKVNKPGAALLRSAKEAYIENGEFVIITPFPIHADRLKSDKVLPDLQKASESLSKGTKVSIRVGKRGS